MLVDFVSMSAQEKQDFVVSLGEHSFRAKQIDQWIYGQSVIDYELMTNLSMEFRERLTNSGVPVINATIMAEKRVKTTQKMAISLADKEVVEIVIMRYHYGITLCLSSQVGCRMACTICASGKAGFKRNLSAEEMVTQVLMANAQLKMTGERITHLVMMGMGEPLDNYEQTIRFLQLATSKDGLNISARRITVSTCGLVPQIDRLANEGLAITLSISLHAPIDEIRNQIVPMGKIYRIGVLMASIRRYSEKTGRRVTFEYALIKDVNDSQRCANELVAQLKGLPAHVNLIGLNPVPGSLWKSSNEARIRRFAQLLELGGLHATIRRELGREIEGSCGQLSMKITKQEE
ncbi:MAG: 23S rRNA (adenine(2503)-C(2))-methyltransferase RlmN [bacterium]|nr:23S rRNA (adenine(2503)-C(2))-methyltransferase RlmN [bacterium]